MSQIDEDLEIVSEVGTNSASDEWLREGSTVSRSEDVTPPHDSSLGEELNNNNRRGSCKREVICSKRPNSAAKIKAERLVSLLGVRNKADPLTDWDNLYNLKSQSALRKDCREMLERLGEGTNWTLPQVEDLMTLYCKRRNVDYRERCWIDILGKLLILPFEDHCTLFNVFWAITTKYVPKSSKMFDLYRLLLQYHDPQLCSHLDSYKIKPEDYTNDWFCALLARDLEVELCWQIWDTCFDRGDPYLIFFVALAFAQGVREEIFQMSDRARMVDLLKEVPRKMGPEDVNDLLEVCFVQMHVRTPVSIREDFHCMLFGSNLVEEYSEFPLHRLICLPVSTQELCRRAIDVTSPTSATFGYFVIDTRPQKCFNVGCVSGSYNLNAETIVEDPEKFGFAMSSLMRFKEDNYPKDHICFLGSGREEEDQFMNMAISRFLAQNYEHISYADGGYRALHGMLTDTRNLHKLSNHFKKNDCLECKAKNEEDPAKGKSIFDRFKKSIQINRKPSLTGILPRIPAKNESVKHVNSTDRFGKRYRNVQSVFSLNNEDSLSSDVDDLHNMQEIEPGMRASEKLKWAEVVRKAEICEHFDGEEVLAPEDKHVPCYIALSRTHMHIFHVVANEPGLVFPSLRHPLSSIMRVTSKRRFPEFLTFKFGYELPTGESHINRVHYFILPKAGDCAKAVKLAILALKSPAVEKEGVEKRNSD